MKRAVSSCCSAPVRIVEGMRVCMTCSCVAIVEYVDAEPVPDHAEAKALDALIGAGRDFVKGHITPMTTAEVGALNAQQSHDPRVTHADECYGCQADAVEERYGGRLAYSKFECGAEVEWIDGRARIVTSCGKHLSIV